MRLWRYWSASQVCGHTSIVATRMSARDCEQYSKLGFVNKLTGINSLVISQELSNRVLHDCNVSGGMLSTNDRIISFCVRYHQ